MIVYGINSVVEAIKAGKAKVVYLRDDKCRRAEILKLAKEKGVRVVTKNTPSGVAADVFFNYSSFDELLTGESFILFADNVEDPRNLGALIRTAVFFGCSGVAIKRRRAVKVTDTVVKTSAGAVFHTKIAFASVSELKKAKKLGYYVLAAELDGKDIRSSNLVLPAVLVIGGEDRGISKPVKKLCDEIVKIHGKGEIGSLNLSVAAGIVMYELTRSV